MGIVAGLRMKLVYLRAGSYGIHCIEETLFM